MSNSRQIVLLLVAVVGQLLQFWCLYLEWKQVQALEQKTEDTWPLKFSSYWMDYVLGPRTSRYGRIALVVFTFLGACEFLLIGVMKPIQPWMLVAGIGWMAGSVGS